MKFFFSIIFSLFFTTIFCQETISKNKKYLGTISEFVTNYKVSTSSKKAIDISLPNGKTYTINIDVNNSTKHFYDIGGKIINENNARFYFTGSDNKISGQLYFLNEKKAYSIYNDNTKKVYIKEIDINEILCVEFPKNHEEKEPQSISNDEIKRALKNVKKDKNGPLLESFPGATGVIYLDFDGENLTNSSWGNINCVAHGYTNASIYLIWSIMSEDFSPFNLNVTTDRSIYESYPSTRRQMVIFTPTDDAAPGAGGVANLWSFANNNRVCFSFITSAGNAAEVASHEIGHTFGLRHDGTGSVTYYSGHGNWAPIMGSTYTRNVAQWSKGEYAGANNAQDDLAIISGSSNGVGYRTDDHSNAINGATPLIMGFNNELRREDNYGIIERATDKDYFVFSTFGGPVNFDFYPQDKFTKSPNLDIQVRLLDNNGTELLVSDISTASLAANINTTLTAGTYYLEIDGVGHLNPSNNGYSDYSSIGKYSIAGTYPKGDNSLSPTPTISYFNNCETINFEGKVVNGYDSLYWDFGDGSFSNDLSPSHTYNASNNYTVTFTAFNSNGSNTSSESINIEFIAPPSAVNDTSCSNNGNITLKASGGSGFFNWYDAQTAGNKLYSGPEYSTNITQTTSFYVQETNAKAPGKIGPSDNTIGPGGNYDKDKLWGLFFDAHEDFTLRSVKVYAASAGPRIVRISKEESGNYGTLIQKILPTVPQGESRLDLNVLIPKGTQYFIQISGANVDLYRNTAGASFPYTYNNVATITRNNDYSNPNYYYYFYDWEIEPLGCSSERTEVTGYIESCVGINETNNNNSSITAHFKDGFNYISVQLNNIKQENIEVSILNNVGQIVHRATIAVAQESVEKKDIKIPNIANGIYYVNFHGKNIHQTVKLIKAN